MAPQNSTLLYENAELSTELSHFSPIQKPTYHDTTETCSNSTDTDEIAHSSESISKFDRANYDQVENEIPIWICGKPRFMSGITNNTTCSDLIQALIDDELNSSTVDVTASRDLNDYVITEKWRDVEQALPGDTKILPIWMAWGCVQYEVKFKLKINKNKAGTGIPGDYSNDNGDANRYDKRLKQDDRYKRPSAVTHLMKRLIEQGESIKQHLRILREKNSGDLDRLTSRELAKHHSPLLNSFLNDSLKLKSITLNDKNIADSQDNQIVTRMKQAKQRRPQEIDTTSLMSNDELFLMIDDDTCNELNDHDGNVHVEYRQYYLNRKLDLAIAAAKVSVSSSNNTNPIDLPKQKSISRKLEFDARRQNCFNKRLIKHLCENINQRQMRHRQRMPKNCSHDNTQNTVDQQIERLMRDLKHITDNEEELMNDLGSKCERYRNQNNKYMTNTRLKLRIDEVQHSLDVYAKEIIENELELHRIQTDIQRKYDILFNLTKKSERFDSLTHDSDNTFNTSIFNADKSLII